MENEVYKTEKLSEHIYRISELNIVNCFLIVGEKKAMLIDCGLGVSYIREEVRKITELPVFLVASHAHVDHIGGAREFGKMYIHRVDVPLVTYSNSLSQRIDFLKKHKMWDSFRSDGHSLPMYKPYLTLRPFCDNKVFDLGGIKVETVRTPGHTAGSCVFRIKDDNIVIVGDNFIPVLYLHYDFGSSLSEWVKAYDVLAEKAKGCVLYGSHGKNAVSEEGLRWQYETAKEIIASTSKNARRRDRKIITVTHPEHVHLCVKYRTDKIL